MLTLQECLDFSGLDPDELAALAEGENVPDIVAAEMANQLLQSPRGIYRLHCIFRDLIARTDTRKNRAKVRQLEQTYAHFCARHPVPRVL